MATVILKGRNREVSISSDDPTRIIGERCNALGYKAVKRAAEEGRLDEVARRARQQVQAGADAVNVNMVGTSIPEENLLPRAVERIAVAVDVPLSIDFGSLAALEAALKVAPGRALINSTNGEIRKLDPVLELAAKYRAAAIALACDENGIPPDAAARVRIVERILKRAETFGLGAADLLADTVCLGVGTDPSAGPVTFEACRRISGELGLNVVLGASNAAYGLPLRKYLNASYLALAIGSGMNVALTDPTLPELRWAILGADACIGRDEFCANFIRQFRLEEKAQAAKEVTANA
ncbi:MAG: dihydropteroate synthase [Planctomycetota bacterium]|nr:dihydropteroate synthase [Planctomycetota bacterium]